MNTPIYINTIYVPWFSSYECLMMKYELHRTEWRGWYKGFNYTYHILNKRVYWLKPFICNTKYLYGFGLYFNKRYLSVTRDK